MSMSEGSDFQKALHAYWRYEYIEAPKEKNQTLFEDIAKSLKGSDEDNYVLKRTLHSYLMLNAFPYTAGHLLAIPNKTVQHLNDLSADERADWFDLVAFAETLLHKALHPDGLNIGMNLGKCAGAGIPSHLHMHIVARWIGDHNFMPVIGETRVLSSSLQTMWKRLKAFC